MALFSRHWREGSAERPRTTTGTRMGYSGGSFCLSRDAITASKR
jgi:hypothetical protein